METTVSRFKVHINLVQIYSECWSMLKCHCAHYAYAALDIRRKRCNALVLAAAWNIFQVLEGALKDLCKYWVCHRHLHRHRSIHLAHNFTQDAIWEGDWIGYGVVLAHFSWTLTSEVPGWFLCCCCWCYSVFGFLFLFALLWVLSGRSHRQQLMLRVNAHFRFLRQTLIPHSSHTQRVIHTPTNSYSLHPAPYHIRTHI